MNSDKLNESGQPASGSEPALAIERVDSDKRAYMHLLLIGDESEPMIGRYLDRGTLYVGRLGEQAVAVCMTTDEGPGLIEVKNLAVLPDYRRRGIGRAMLLHVERMHPGMTLTLGTGETPSTLRFYRSCGYRFSHRVPGFFTDHYPSPIVEEGVTLRDMVYLVKP